MENEKLPIQVGDQLYSDFFKAYLRVERIVSIDEWYFSLRGKIGTLKAQTSLVFWADKPELIKKKEL